MNLPCPHRGEWNRTAKALENYDPYQVPEIKVILEGSMAALVELTRQKGVESDPEGHYSICHMCESLGAIVIRFPGDARGTL